MTIDVEHRSPLPPIDLVGDGYRLRPFRTEDLHLVKEASRDDFIPLITTVPSEWSPEQGNAFIEPWNTASIKTAERAGYEREGLLRSWERVGKIPRDMWSYAQTRPVQAV